MKQVQYVVMFLKIFIIFFNILHIELPKHIYFRV
jgi:hypothetical protein